jgi:hypothetical protein
MRGRDEILRFLQVQHPSRLLWATTNKGLLLTRQVTMNARNETDLQIRFVYRTPGPDSTASGHIMAHEVGCAFALFHAPAHSRDEPGAAASHHLNWVHRRIQARHHITTFTVD